MLNDARLASRGFVKDNICTTRIHKEKKFKIKFQVLLKFAQILPDYDTLIELFDTDIVFKRYYARQSKMFYNAEKEHFI